MEEKENEVTIRYEIHGEGKPIFMLHGYSLDRSVMTGCMEPLFLNRSGWQRIYFDLPGMGETKGESWISNSDQMLEISMSFIKKIAKKRAFAVAGLSYGGYLARGLMNKMQSELTGALLIVPVIDFERAKRRVPELKVFEKDEDLLNSLPALERDEFEACVVLQNQDIWQRFQTEILPGIRKADYRLLERVRDTEFAFNPDMYDQPFDKPVCFLMARQDNSVGFLDGLRICNNYPHASVGVFDQAGHCLQLEKESLFNAMVNDWLDRVENSMEYI